MIFQLTQLSQCRYYFLYRVYALDSITGKTVARLKFLDADNCDWEDIAVGPGPGGKSFIYVGDIGGNSERTCNVIYR